MKLKDKLKVTPFDFSDYIDNDKLIVALIKDALESGDDTYLYSVIGDIAKAKGMTKLAKETGLNRSTLYKMLSKDGKPSFLYLYKVLKSLGITLEPTLKNNLNKTIAI